MKQLHCLQSTICVRWEHRVTSDEVRFRALAADNCPPTGVIALHSLRWVGHLLRMPSPGLHFVLFPTCWTRLEEVEWRSINDMAWRYEKSSVGFGLCYCFPPSWLGPKIWGMSWLETMTNTAQNRSMDVVWPKTTKSFTKCLGWKHKKTLGLSRFIIFPSCLSPLVEFYSDFVALAPCLYSSLCSIYICYFWIVNHLEFLVI